VGVGMGVGVNGYWTLTNSLGDVVMV